VSNTRESNTRETIEAVIKNTEEELEEKKHKLQLEQRRIDIYSSWVYNLISDWKGEYGAWDDLLESGEVTDEDLDWIRENLKVDAIHISKIHQ